MTILFDLDGTLIDSTQAILESFFVAFDNKHVKRPNENDIKNLIGYPLEIMFENLGIKKEYCNEFVLEYKNHYRKISTKKTQLLPQAKEAIILSAKVGKIGVVTTKTALYSKEILDHFGVLEHFGVVIGREDVINPKPHKEPIEKALKLLNTQPSKDIFMIGDTVLDLQSAENAKISSIGVLCGYGKEEDLKKYTSQICINSLEAVKRTIIISKR